MVIIMTLKIDLTKATVKELKTEAKRLGLSRYSKMRKAELIALIKNAVSKKDAEYKKAKDDAKLVIGSDFDRAIMFWGRLKGVKKFKTSDWAEMADAWTLLRSLINTEELGGDLLDTAVALKEMFGLTDDISKFSVDELKEFIESILDDFSMSVFSEKLHKETFDLIKFDIKDLSFGDKVEFDSSRLYDPTTCSKVPTNGIPVLKTAEDGISRTLREMNINTASIKMAWTSADETEQEVIDAKKRTLLNNGFYDTATGIHYYPAFQSPSSNRKATVTFVQVTGDTHEERVEQVTSLWCKVTGFNSWEEFVNALASSEEVSPEESAELEEMYQSDKRFGIKMMIKGGYTRTEDGCWQKKKAVMAKVVARTATRGSNSLSIKKLNPEMDAIIKAMKVEYVSDTETNVIKKYRTYNTDNGQYAEFDGQGRLITDADGQALGNYTFFACVACAMRLISRNEYDCFVTEWEKCGKDIHNIQAGSKLDKVIRKIPAVVQIRHGEKKGLIVRWNLEAIDATSEMDVIIPDSVRKFVGSEWNEYDLEICNHLKSKPKRFAYLNPQFISALEWNTPNALINIVKYWEQYQLDSVHNVAKSMEFHGMLQSSDEDNSDNASTLVEALRTNSSLVNDYQIINWRKEQYNKFNDDMSIGRIMLPGQYTYMIFDPAYVLNQWFGLDLHCLESGNYYYNDKDCEAGLFRSPMIAPFEAQKVQLVADEEYKYLQNVIVFNGHDGLADDMGGGDHDGDQCLVVTSDTEFGKLVIDGVRNKEFIVWEEAKKAQKVELTWDNFIEYLATSGSVVDRTGPITNYGTKALDIANHLRSCIHFAKQLGCDDITFVHPKCYGKGLGWNVEPSVQSLNGGKTFACKALIEAKFTKQAKSKYANTDFKPSDVEPCDVSFQEGRGMVGTFTFEEVEKEIEYYMNIVYVVRLLQGEEIDGAKTGFHPEIADFVKISITPLHMLNRQEVLGREQSVASKINCYVSLSPLGRVHTYTEKYVKPKLEDSFQAGSSKSWLLNELLFDNEREDLYKKFQMQDGSQKNVIEIAKIRKSNYNKAVYNYLQSGEDTKESLRQLKENEINELNNLAVALNMSIETVAVACYLAVYTKNEKQSEGLTYAWLLSGELLSVFSRGNKQYISVRLPKNIDTAEVKNEVLYVNDKPYIRVRAYDGMVPVHCIKGTVFGLVHKKADMVAEKKVFVPSTSIYTITAVGFKYYLAGAKDEWKQIVAGNNYTFDVDTDDTDRPVIKVNGRVISSIVNDSLNLYELKGHTVKVVNNSSYCPNEPVKESNASIANLKVMVIA